jgi:hypothetical protein
MPSWIVRADRTVTEVVPAPPEVVRSFYVNLDNLKLLHPFLVSVRTMSHYDGAHGYRQTYRVRENVPLGKLTLPIRFVAQLEVPFEGDVVALTRQFPQVRLRTATSFQSDSGDAGRTRVVERMNFAAPWPLAGITVREGYNALWQQDVCHTALQNVRDVSRA